jgi:hypothetical protein
VSAYLSEQSKAAGSDLSVQAFWYLAVGAP